MAQFAPPPTYANPVLLDEKTGQVGFNPVWLQWFIDLVGIINASGGTSLGDHNLLTGLQGGTAGTPGERYHFTQTEHTNLGTLSPVATTLAALGALTGLSVTITTAKLTPAGLNGSMTFTNGLLTAQTQAT